MTSADASRTSATLIPPNATLSFTGNFQRRNNANKN